MASEVVFSRCKELTFLENHASSSLVVGDVDGDGKPEVVIGGLGGSLAVFKGFDSSEPFAVASGLGMLRVLAVGKVLPHMTCSQLIAITVDGSIHVFNVQQSPSSSPPGRPSTYKEPHKLAPIFTEVLDCSVTAAVAADVDGDGVDELLIGCCDGDVFVLGFAQGCLSPHDQLHDHSSVPEEEESVMHEKAVGKASAGVMSLAVVTGAAGQSFVVAGLETGTVEVMECRLRHLDQSHGDSVDVGMRSPHHHEEQLPLVELAEGRGLPLPEGGWCGPFVCADVRIHHNERCTEGDGGGGGPRGGANGDGYGSGDDGSDVRWPRFAIAGLDGRLALAEVMVKGDDVRWGVLWSMQTQHPLFALAPLMLDGQPVVAACGWSGMTYLVESGDAADDEDRRVLTFDSASMLVPPLRAFQAGEVDGESCLLYSCADGRVLVFHDLPSHMPDKASPALQRLKSEETKGLVQAWVDLYFGGGSRKEAPPGGEAGKK